MKQVVKLIFFLCCVVSFFGCAADIQITPRPVEPAPSPRPGIQPWDLKVLQLQISPDPVREGQYVTFQAVVSNLSQASGRINFLIRDRDEVITQAYDTFIRPGENRVFFPQTRYRFSQSEHCFSIEADIERTRRSIDAVEKFCARRTHQGWSMITPPPRVGPFFVEDLDLIPDPAFPGQEVRFKARLRNDGVPTRANVRIHDRDQLVAQVKEAFLPHGVSDVLFPFTRHTFQRFDHCFTVVLDVERTPHKLGGAREFCAKPRGWTLRP